MSVKGKKYHRVKRKKRGESGIMDRLRKPMPPADRVLRDRSKYRRTIKHPDKSKETDDLD